MTANTSGGRDEMGENALRRLFSARMDSFNDSISTSMACCERSQVFAWPAFIGVAEGAEETL